MTDSGKTGSPPAVSDIDRLRDLILGEDIGDLKNLYRRVSDPESRTGDVAEVLPGAMNRVVEDPVARPQIERPIVDTIRGAIHHDAESFAEALFPVLGPAIRHAVADSLKSLVQRINVALEHSFTVKGLRWRMEAARSGVPFGQIVLRETMLYAVQEVFLIQPDSGLVLAKARRDEALILDEDAFSAMLTAIQAFIQDSLGMSTGEKLRSAELGDRNLWVINGPKAALACVISGSPPLAVRDQMMDTLEVLHARFGDQFDQPPERLADQPGIEALMLDTLQEEVAEAGASDTQSKFKYFWGGLGLLLLLLLAWGGWNAWNAYQFRQDAQQVINRFEQEPGYVLTSHDASDKQLLLSGLRDPIAASPDSVLQDSPIDAANISLQFRPYQSLENEIILRRLRSALGEDPGIELELTGAALKVTGILTATQFALLEALPATHPMIQSVNLEHAQLAGQKEADAQKELELRHQQLDRLISNVDGWTIGFTARLEISTPAQGQLDRLAGQLIELREMATSLQENLTVNLEGFADGAGSQEMNNKLALDRSRLVLSELSNRGIDPAAISLTAGHWVEGVVDPAQRKVVVHVVRETVR